MDPYPHHYAAEASGAPEGTIELRSEGLPAIGSAAPAEFDGPGDRWSPETLLLGAVADCFVLTFRAVATASHFEWESLSCRAEGTLDRVDRALRFVAIALDVELRTGDEARADTARRLLEKTERSCLITNSLAVPVEMKLSVT